MSNDLIVSKNSGAAPEPATSDLAGGEQAGFASLPNTTRRAEIESIMKTDISRYYREGLDRELLGLIEEETSEADPDYGDPTRPMKADDSRTMLCSSAAGQQMVVEWERYGGFQAHLANVQVTVGEIVRGLGDNRQQRAFMARFDRDVPEAAGIAVYAEIAAGAPSFVTPATKAEINHFAATQVGRTLVDEWGGMAATKVATLRMRAARLNELMFEDEGAEFWSWFEDLDPANVTTIFRKLAR